MTEAHPPAWVTCAPSGDPEEARALARECGLRFVERGVRTLGIFLAEAGENPVLVLARDRALLHVPGVEDRGGRRGRDEAPGFRLTPGMSVLRLLRAARGEHDPLVRAAGLRPGDRVLDATLGLGGDALLAAQATGAPVVGLEASALLAACARASLARLRGPGPAPAEAAARIEVRWQDHRAALAALPDHAFDVVLLDPMFRAPGASAPAFDLVRAFADGAPLSPETLRQARRVARRGVLVKDSPPGVELARLGLSPVPGRRLPRIVFGWADAR